MLITQEERAKELGLQRSPDYVEKVMENEVTVDGVHKMLRENSR